MQNQALEKSDSAENAIMLADENAKIATEEKNEALRLRMLSVGKTVSVKSILLQGQKELQALLAFQAYLFNRKITDLIMMQIFTPVYTMLPVRMVAASTNPLKVITEISEALPLFLVRTNFLLPEAMGKC